MPADSPIEIQAQALSKSFGDHAVLKGIDVTVHPGEIVAIVGGSGSGKTVLLDHLIGLMQPDSGQVLAADHNADADAAGQWPLVDLSSADSDQLDQLRVHWSVVFQRNALFSGTVRDNVALWLREHTPFDDNQIEQRVHDSVQAAQLDVNDVLDKERDALSGGMAKRVAIARAIAADPIVVFYDEPTTGLDPVLGGAIHELVWEFHRRPVGPRPKGPRVPPNLLDRLAETLPVADELLPEGILSAAFASGRQAAAAQDSAQTEPRTPDADPQPPRTTIFVTHDKELLRRLQPRIVMLDEGGVCFDGPYDRFGKDGCEPAQAYLEEMPVLHRRGM